MTTYEVCVFDHCGGKGNPSKQLDNSLVYCRDAADQALLRFKRIYAYAYIIVRQYYKRHGHESFRVLHKLTYDGTMIGEKS